jgi:hypothetical protein
MNWGMISYELPLDAVERVIASMPPEKFIAQYEAGRAKR